MIGFEMKRSKKVAYLISDLGTGGQERQLFYLISNLPAHYDAYVYPMNFNSQDKYVEPLNKLGVTVCELEGDSRFQRLRALHKAILELSPDIIHSYSFHLNFTAWLVSLFTRAKVFGGVRNQLINNRDHSGKFSFYSSLLFPRFRISNHYEYLRGASSAIRKIDKYWTKTFVVHNGIDLGDYKNFFPSDSGIPLKSGSVFRFHSAKRMDLMLQLFSELKKEGIPIQHQHAGSGDDFEKIKQEIHRLNLQDSFELIGEVRDLSEFWRDKHIMFHTADYEGCPNVVLEAMACGKPILSTNCGDVEHIVREGENGWVVPFDNQTKLVNAARKVVSDPGKLKVFGSRSRQLIEGSFSLLAYREKVIGIYEKFI